MPPAFARVRLKSGDRLFVTADRVQLTKVYCEIERFILTCAVAEIRRLRAQNGALLMAAPPAQQLSALLKSAKSGGLRGAVARAAGTLADGQLAFQDLHGTLTTYETAVEDARQLAAFVRAELQAEGDNGGPPGSELGNSSAGSQASPQTPAATATPAASSAASPPQPAAGEQRASNWSGLHPSLRRQVG